jgi:hypothetical protein
MECENNNTSVLKFISILQVTADLLNFDLVDIFQ